MRDETSPDNGAVTPDPGDALEIEIRLPLPMDVVTTLTRLIASAYPKATFTEHQGFSPSLKISLPGGSRPLPIRRRSTPARASQVAVLESAPQRFGIGGPAEMVRAFGEVIHQSFVDHPDARHYLEMPCRFKDTTYVLTFSRGIAQTPMVLHSAAERRARVAEGRLAELASAGEPLVRRVALALARQAYESELAAAMEGAAAAGRDLSVIAWADLGEHRERLVAAQWDAAAAAVAAVTAAPDGMKMDG